MTTRKRYSSTFLQNEFAKYQFIFCIRGKTYQTAYELSKSKLYLNAKRFIINLLNHSETFDDDKGVHSTLSTTKGNCDGCVYFTSLLFGINS